MHTLNVAFGLKYSLFCLFVLFFFSLQTDIPMELNGVSPPATGEDSCTSNNLTQSNSCLSIISPAILYKAKGSSPSLHAPPPSQYGRQRVYSN